MLSGLPFSKVISCVKINIMKVGINQNRTFYNLSRTNTSIHMHFRHNCFLLSIKFNIVKLELMGEHNGKVLILICTVMSEHIHFEGIVPHCREETMSLE